MASLGLMSPGAATDGVTLFFLGKTGDLFNYRPLESDVSLPLPPFNVVYPVLFLNSATKIISFGCHPWMVSAGEVRPLVPLLALLCGVKYISIA